MKMKMKRRIAVLLIAVMMIAVFPAEALAGQSVNNSIGTVTISIEDFGIRIPGQSGVYPTQFGEIAGPVEIEIFAGDTIAAVTLRFFDQQRISCRYDGRVSSADFYLTEISDFRTKNNVYVPYLAEFDAGPQSGWMVTLNNWYINQSAALFPVENGDVIKWRYTCQLGRDIGCGISDETYVADIKSLLLVNDYGALSPAFSTNVKSYKLYVPPTTTSIKVEAEVVNAWSIVTYTVNAINYKIWSSIPVQNATEIVIRSEISEFFNDPYPFDTDQVTLSIGYLGDMNSDGRLRAIDVATILNLIMSGTRPNAANSTIAADYNRDGRINAVDYAMVLEYVMSH